MLSSILLLCYITANAFALPSERRGTCPTVPKSSPGAVSSPSAKGSPGAKGSTGAFTNDGVATFNDYAAQGGCVCGQFKDMHFATGVWPAAAGSISPDIGLGAGSCTEPVPRVSPVQSKNCAGQHAVPSYVAPSCSNDYCAPKKCYTVTNAGVTQPNTGATTPGIGNTITVQVIDVCPANHAENYCKSEVPARERCTSATTNSLDIDINAYSALTGRPYQSGVTSNLNITIAATPCP